MPEERLQKILSNAGIASRRQAEAMIVAGRVAVNGTVLDRLGSRADPDTDVVTLDGEPVVKSAYVYLVLNKPAGVVTSARDERGRKTVLQFVPNEPQLHPVGRLDVDSEGLVILTNDGELTNRLTHPKFEVDKEYLVGVHMPVSKDNQRRMVRGIEDGSERLRASSVKTVEPDGALGSAQAGAWLLVVLRQGRNREIRRMMAALDRRVVHLRRIRIGPLSLGDLSVGRTRQISHDEVAALYKASKQQMSAVEKDVADKPESTPVEATAKQPMPAMEKDEADKPESTPAEATAKQPMPAMEKDEADKPESTPAEAASKPQTLPKTAKRTPKKALDAPSPATKPKAIASAPPKVESEKPEPKPADPAPLPSPPKNDETAEVTASKTPSSTGATLSGIPRIVALDGTAASGKTTLARALAKRFGHSLLDTGRMYRAFTLAAQRAEIPPSDLHSCRRMARGLDMRIETRGTDSARILLATEDVTGLLRAPEIERRVSDYATIPAVRERLVELQREFAEKHPCVMVGRDIGTVVLPDAPAKIFLTASEDARAERRQKQATEWGMTPAQDKSREDISNRDKTDSTRATSPLKPAEDAVVIDTTDLNPDEVMTVALEGIGCASD